MLVEEQAIEGGWYRCTDRNRRQLGRYCDGCDARIAEDEVYFTMGKPASTIFGVNPSPDYCERCYKARTA